MLLLLLLIRFACFDSFAAIVEYQPNDQLTVKFDALYIDFEELKLIFLHNKLFYLELFVKVTRYRMTLRHELSFLTLSNNVHTYKPMQQVLQSQSD